MCTEQMYRSNCRHRDVNSYSPQRWHRCPNPNNFPECVINNAIIDDVDVRDHTCKRCVKPLLPVLNYAAEVNTYASSAYRENPRDQVPRPPAYISRWFPRPLPGSATVELEGSQAGTAPQGAPDIEPDIQPEMAPAVTDFDEEERDSVHPRSHLYVPTLNSPSASSSQRTGMVYTAEGQRYPHTVYDSTENPDWVGMVEGTQRVFEDAQNDPQIMEEAAPEVTEELRADLNSGRRL